MISFSTYCGNNGLHGIIKKTMVGATDSGGTVQVEEVRS